MDIKLKYREWVGEKHADIASPLINSDIETFAIQFAEWLLKKSSIPAVNDRSEQLVCECQRNNPYTGTKFDFALRCSDCNKIIEQDNCL